MLTDRIQEKLNELSTLPGVVAIGLGKKIIGGVQTDIIGITFGVKIKEANPENMLPTSIDIDGVMYITDVVEIGEVSFSSCPVGPIVTEPEPYIHSGMLIHTVHRDNTSQTDLTLTSGTLGIVAYHPGRNVLVGITAAHLLSDPSRPSTPNREAYTNHNTGSMASGGSPNFNYGYGYTNSTDFFNFNDRTMKLGYYSPLKVEPITNPNRFNQVDACLLYFDTSKSVSPIIPDTAGTSFEISPYYNPSWKSYNVKGIPEITSPMPFATTAELNALITNPPSQVSSTGFGTGVKHGAECGLKIDAIGVTTSFTTNLLPTTGLPGTVYFDNLISFSRALPSTPSVVGYGDSGASLIAKINNVWKIIGLVIGGTSPSGVNQTGYACRIDKVAEELEIEAWDGSIKPLGTSYSSRGTPVPVYVIAPGINDSKKLNFGNRTYYQIGTTTISSIIYYE